jgi:hypothetical protein
MKQPICYVAKGNDTRHEHEITIIYSSETMVLHGMKYGFVDAVTFHHCRLESSSSMRQCIEWCHEVLEGVILDVI